MKSTRQTKDESASQPQESTEPRKRTARTKRGKREENKERTKERILAAALKLFRKHGLEGTTTKQISQEAGIAEGTLFHYDPLELADPRFMDSLGQLAKTLVRNKFLSPDFIFLSRTESGMCNLLHMLKSRVPTTQIAREFIG